MAGKVCLSEEDVGAGGSGVFREHFQLQLDVPFFVLPKHRRTLLLALILMGCNFPNEGPYLVHRCVLGTW